jgi:hypothetical protein
MTNQRELVDLETDFGGEHGDVSQVSKVVQEDARLSLQGTGAIEVTVYRSYFAWVSIPTCVVLQNVDS